MTGVSTAIYFPVETTTGHWTRVPSIWELVFSFPLLRVFILYTPFPRLLTKTSLRPTRAAASYLHPIDLRVPVDGGAAPERMVCRGSATLVDGVSPRPGARRPTMPPELCEFRAGDLPGEPHSPTTHRTRCRLRGRRGTTAASPDRIWQGVLLLSRCLPALSARPAYRGAFLSPASRPSSQA